MDLPLFVGSDVSLSMNASDSIDLVSFGFDHVGNKSREILKLLLLLNERKAILRDLVLMDSNF
jgi:hypothetical protein